jgi:hypothetical protein
MVNDFFNLYKLYILHHIHTSSALRNIKEILRALLSGFLHIWFQIFYKCKIFGFRKNTENKRVRRPSNQKLVEKTPRNLLAASLNFFVGSFNHCGKHTLLSCFNRAIRGSISTGQL